MPFVPAIWETEIVRSLEVGERCSPSQPTRDFEIPPPTPSSRNNPGVTDTELAKRVRALRAKGSSPKEIARVLGMPSAQVGRLVKAIAAADATDPAEGAIVECLVSPGWSAGLAVDGHPDWPDTPVTGSGADGIVCVLIARDAGRHKVSVCTYLVDVYCLGVKNTIGPRIMDRNRAAEFARQCFSGYDANPIAAPVDLARHLVFGAVEYARGLGFEPAPDSDFDKTSGHLGPWTGPSAITFGRDGKPFYIQGPRDNAAHVMRTLQRSVGKDNFHFTVTA